MDDLKQYSEKPIEADEKNFKVSVVESSFKQPILVDFWAEWCSPCLVIAPRLMEVVTEYQGKVLLAKVEVDDNMRLAGKYKIRGFPSILFFYHGQEVSRFSGAIPKIKIRKFIDDCYQKIK
ncbi:MAG: thioredoxin [Methylococcales bacterium]|jgi:putative thioredoxin|nr:thioredoxin [Methylococcales bacterium]MBT7410535.1 thioredoxin [Methylococcales bacterium]